MDEKSKQERETQFLKRQIKRAQQRAVEILLKTGYNIIDSNDDPFSFMGVRGNDVRFIRVALGPADSNLIGKIKRMPCPLNCSKEIWEKRNGDFVLKEIK